MVDAGDSVAFVSIWPLEGRDSRPIEKDDGRCAGKLAGQSVPKVSPITHHARCTLNGLRCTMISRAMQIKIQGSWLQHPHCAWLLRDYWTMHITGM